MSRKEEKLPLHVGKADGILQTQCRRFSGPKEVRKTAQHVRGIRTGTEYSSKLSREVYRALSAE